MVEKRSEERIKSNLKADVLDLKSKKVVSRSGRVENISRGGFSILTEDPLALRTPYLFKVSLDISHAVEIEGQVIHGKRDSIYQISGVRINVIPLDHRIRFNRFIMGNIPSVQKKFLVYALLAGAGIYMALKFFGLSTTATIITGIFTVVALLLWAPF